MIDANRLLSALLTDGRSRRCLEDAPCRFIAPEALWVEVRRHVPAMARRAGADEGTMQAVAHALLRLVEPVGEELLATGYDQAVRTLGAVDPDDVPYLATALAMQADAIWSHDKHFDQQDLVPRVDWP